MSSSCLACVSDEVSSFTSTSVCYRPQCDVELSSSVTGGGHGAFAEQFL